jgi:hypothetical protein
MPLAKYSLRETSPHIRLFYSRSLPNRLPPPPPTLIYVEEIAIGQAVLFFESSNLTAVII